MEGEKAKSYLDLLPPEIGARINRLLKANPTFAMIMDLPYEVRMYVVVQMPYPDVLRFCATSKEAKKVCDDDYFWKLKVAHDFPETPAEGYEGRWLKKYKEYWQEAEEKLVECARDGHIKCVKSLLQLGIDPDSYDRTTLMVASRRGHTEIVEMLLRAGADPNIQDEDGNTALIEASIDENPEIIEKLLRAGADVNARTNKLKHSALNISSYYGNILVVRKLLEAGANVNVQNGFGQTPLLSAIDGESPRPLEIAKLLLEAGADPNIQDEDGVTTLGVAHRYGDEDLADLIKSYIRE